MCHGWDIVDLLVLLSYINWCLLLVMAMAYSSHAKVIGRGSSNHYTPAPSFFFFFNWRLARAHEFYSFRPRLGEKWFSMLRPM